MVGNEEEKCLALNCAAEVFEKQLAMRGMARMEVGQCMFSKKAGRRNGVFSKREGQESS